MAQEGKIHVEGLSALLEPSGKEPSMLAGMQPFKLLSGLGTSSILGDNMLASIAPFRDEAFAMIGVPALSKPLPAIVKGEPVKFTPEEPQQIEGSQEALDMDAPISNAEHSNTIDFTAQEGEPLHDFSLDHPIATPELMQHADSLPDMSEYLHAVSDAGENRRETHQRTEEPPEAGVGL